MFTFTPDDNLVQPWKPNPSAQNERIKTSLLTEDAGYFEQLAKQYREVHGGKDPPASGDGDGSFARWAYFHFGRWSLAARAWWIPRPKDKSEAASAPAAEKSADAAPNASKPAAEERPADAAAGKPPGDKQPGLKSATRSARKTSEASTIWRRLPGSKSARSMDSSTGSGWSIPIFRARRWKSEDSSRTCA